MSDFEISWMKEPCGPCPFSRSKTLPLHPERAAEFAAMASNPYSDFVCHKTGEVDDDCEEGGIYRGPKSLTCNGFLSLQCTENGTDVEGFTPHPDAFEDCWEMEDTHALLWEERAQAIDARSNTRLQNTKDRSDG